MSLFDIGLGFIVGVVTGVGVSIFYLRWKVSRQLGMMQDSMEDMFEMEGELSEGLSGEMVEDIDSEEVEKEEE